MKAALKFVYNRLVRPYLPRKIAVFNDVPVRGVRLLDFTDVFPDYEASLLLAINERVRSGDDVVLIGGGRGVSTVAAARLVGPAGHVTTYEGSEERFATVNETVDLNRVGAKVEVKNYIVGEAVKLASESDGVETINADSLPPSDVVVLDCEGAEVGILAAIDNPPGVVIVETHGFLGATEELIRTVLDERGYEVVDRRTENDDKGVFVLTAILDRGSGEDAR